MLFPFIIILETSINSHELISLLQMLARGILDPMTHQKHNVLLSIYEQPASQRPSHSEHPQRQQMTEAMIPKTEAPSKKQSKMIRKQIRKTGKTSSKKLLPKNAETILGKP